MDTGWKLNRRKMLGSCLAAGVGVSFGAGVLYHNRLPRSQKRQQSRIAVLNVDSYSERLVEILMQGLKLFDLDMHGKSVLLKPNLVDIVPGKEVTTHPMVVRAAAECFLQMGARQVLTGEGPGHQRDTELVLHESGMNQVLLQTGARFVDLNRDELVKVRLDSNLTGLGQLWLPRSVLEADVIVSMPKVKTHHWAGVSLSMKNMFGIVPGMKYGWPKNLLHWRGIHESIVDICSTVPISLVIADGVLAMEGNGPLHGDTRKLGVLVIGDDPVATDATIVRLMGLLPERIRHLNWAGQFLGNLEDDNIKHLGERPTQPAAPFSMAFVIPFTSGCRLC
jgi:uncharacterized protein (DUF362 family)